MQQRRVLCMPFQARALHKLPCTQMYEPKHSARTGSGGKSSPMPSSTATRQPWYSASTPTATRQPWYSASTSTATRQPWYSASTPTSRDLVLTAPGSSSSSIACTRRYFRESGLSISTITPREPGYPLTSSRNAGQSLGQPDRRFIVSLIKWDCIR
ncbi:uncharacterized protein [Littorina saxatilis]|uniref:uncharacterized protein n=1 Tax=Littorina saxatilis TaxID=31220 RepID=UPI0038B69E8E